MAPKDRVRLEAMAAALFPELERMCPAFLRHKDLLFSPRLLKAHNIDYVQARGRRLSPDVNLNVVQCPYIPSFLLRRARVCLVPRQVLALHVCTGQMKSAVVSDRASGRSCGAQTCRVIKQLCERCCYGARRCARSRASLSC